MFLSVVTLFLLIKSYPGRRSLLEIIVYAIFNNHENFPFLFKVAKSNRNCLLNGGSQCFLNFESVSSYSIRVRSVDSGSPSQSINASFNILLNDVNDQPRGLKLSNYKVKENAPINFKIGNLSASDEDKGQKLNFSLVDDDAGRFVLDSEGVLYKAKSTDYETSKVHHIVAKVTDDGKPSLSVGKQASQHYCAHRISLM